MTQAYSVEINGEDKQINQRDLLKYLTVLLFSPYQKIHLNNDKCYPKMYRANCSECDNHVLYRPNCKF